MRKKILASVGTWNKAELHTLNSSKSTFYSTTLQGNVGMFSSEWIWFILNSFVKEKIMWSACQLCGHVHFYTKNPILAVYLLYHLPLLATFKHKQDNDIRKGSH